MSRRRPARFPVLALAPVACITIAAIAGAVPQAPPDTDIWLASIDLASGVPVMGLPMNLTDRVGYDNQPAFLADGSLVFTAQMGEQTEIRRMLAIDRIVTFTDTAESEYSPTPVPGANEISTIRVEPDGRQRLWAFPLNGAAPRLLLESIEPVGYHAWLDDGTLGLFVLGEPATLVIVAPGAQEGRTVASDIGRSLHRIPGEQRISFLQREGEGWRIRAIDPATDEIEDLGPALEGSQDMAWSPEGRILMAAGSALYVRARQETTWRTVADLEGLVGQITRIAVSPDGARIALVAAN